MIYIPLLLMFVFLACGFPVFLSMAVAGGIGLVVMGGVDTLFGVCLLYTSCPRAAFPRSR